MRSTECNTRDAPLIAEVGPGVQCNLQEVLGDEDEAPQSGELAHEWARRECADRMRQLRAQVRLADEIAFGMLRNYSKL